MRSSVTAAKDATAGSGLGSTGGPRGLRVKTRCFALLWSRTAKKRQKNRLGWNTKHRLGDIGVRSPLTRLLDLGVEGAGLRFD